MKHSNQTSFDEHRADITRLHQTTMDNSQMNTLTENELQSVAAGGIRGYLLGFCFGLVSLNPLNCTKYGEVVSEVEDMVREGRVDELEDYILHGATSG